MRGLALLALIFYTLGFLSFYFGFLQEGFENMILSALNIELIKFMVSLSLVFSGTTLALFGNNSEFGLPVQRLTVFFAGSLYIPASLIFSLVTASLLMRGYEPRIWPALSVAASFIFIGYFISYFIPRTLNENGYRGDPFWLSRRAGLYLLVSGLLVYYIV